ncbi:EthD domain-containing protein [Spirosoma linguale]|uniref:Ethyl tert-butyl ether degradation EthD n=1 Tax=Spirosoma linguale (strain ATCC 33905 / DSM 74 / LMG 10896 / Claus 1) TaxID=504472 RepID=D2QHM2_SPILD|nr:Ethyl tert-butyl ether degradation EthD [Spirosoma linguale DSM 74]
MVKFSIFLRKRAGMSHQEFVAYHTQQHAPLFKALPEVQHYVRHYVQCHALPVSLPGFPSMYYDGITELWFDDVEAIGRLFSAPEYLALIRPDEEKFIAMDECGFLIAEETVII